LKKHYEKIILAILLMVFVVSLIYLIIIIMSSKNITPDMLKLPKKKPDYRKVDFTEPEYNVIKRLPVNDKWLACGPRNKNDKFWTDLMIPFEAARSYYGKKRIVPFYYFMDEYGVNKCPFTGKPLPEPDRRVVVSADKDNDGIPNDKEIEYGMDPENPDDIYQDIDGDGFSNIVEYKINPEWVNNKKLHPPLAHRLYVVKILRTRIGVQLKKVRATGKDKKNWEIYMEVLNKRGQWRTRFPRLGHTINVSGIEYDIVDIKNIKEDVYDKTLKATIKKDRSVVTIQKKGAGEKIKVVVGEPAYAPKKKVYIMDSIDNSRYKGIVGENIVVGDDELGKETYLIVSADAKKDEVVLKDLKNNKNITISDEKMEPPADPGKVSGKRNFPADFPDAFTPPEELRKRRSGKERRFR
jgi:hypothetical protein